MPPDPPGPGGVGGASPAPHRVRAELGGVVEDDAEGVALACEDAAHPVAHANAVVAAGTRRGPILRREDHRLALLEMRHAASGLCARTLLDEQKLPALEVLARLAQQHRQLEGKDHLAVEILVKAVVASGAVAQEQRRGLPLAAAGAESQQSREVRGVTNTPL